MGWDGMGFTEYVRHVCGSGGILGALLLDTFSQFSSKNVTKIPFTTLIRFVKLHVCPHITLLVLLCHQNEYLTT